MALVQIYVDVKIWDTPPTAGDLNTSPLSSKVHTPKNKILPNINACGNRPRVNQFPLESFFLHTSSSQYTVLCFKCKILAV